MSNALMTIEPQEVTKYAQRIKELMPGGGKLTVIEAQSLAQVALLHGLDPFNGEVWYLKYDDGRPIGVMAGIKGHRRAAHRQLERDGGNFWCEFDLLAPDEKKALTIPDNALAFRCRLFDSVMIRQYTETIERLIKAGLPWPDVKNIVGNQPVTVGYGYFTPGEKSKMKPAACGMKRAEADALKRRFDLPFGSAVGAPQDEGDEPDAGGFTVTKPEPAGPATAGNGRSAGSMALYGEPDITEPEPPEPAQPVLEDADLIRAKVGTLAGARHGQYANEKQRGLAVRMLEACFNTDDDGERAECRHRVLCYLFNVSSSKDLEGLQVLAILDWLHPTKDGDGRYQPSEGSILEARIIEHAALLAEGQGELFSDPLVQTAQDLGGVVVESREG